MNDTIMLQVLGDVLKDRLGQPAGANRVMLQALGDVLKNRLKELEENRPLPKVDVVVPVPNVCVSVDMTPVAAALDRMSAAIDSQAAMFARLLEAVLSRPVTIENKIEVMPAPVTVQAPAPVEKRITIQKDADGKWTGEVKPSEPAE